MPSTPYFTHTRRHPLGRHDALERHLHPGVVAQPANENHNRQTARPGRRVVGPAGRRLSAHLREARGNWCKDDYRGGACARMSKVGRAAPSIVSEHRRTGALGSGDDRLKGLEGRRRIHLAPDGRAVTCRDNVFDRRSILRRAGAAGTYLLRLPWTRRYSRLDAWNSPSPWDK